MLALLAFCALAILSACETTGAQRTPVGGSTGQPDLTSATVTGDDWLAQAQAARGARADSLYLNAAQAYLAERRFQGLRDALAAVSPTLNRRDQNQRYAQFRAAWHLNDDNAALARDWLATRDAPSRRNRNSETEPDDYWLLRAAICEKLNDWACVAQALINVRAAERYLSSPWLASAPAYSATSTSGGSFLNPGVPDVAGGANAGDPTPLAGPTLSPPLSGINSTLPATEPAALSSPEAAQQMLNNAIWRALTRTRKSAAEAAASAATRQESAWWDLRLRLAAANDRRSAAQQWQRQHGAHPASFPWPTAIARTLAAPQQMAIASPAQQEVRQSPQQQEQQEQQEQPARQRTRRPFTEPAGTLEVAVLLPLSGRLAAAGTAVRDGFIATQLALPAPINARFYDVSGAPLATVLDSLAASTDLIVGPLSKEQVAEFAQLETAVPRLALNYLQSASDVESSVTTNSDPAGLEQTGGNGPDRSQTDLTRPILTPADPNQPELNQQPVGGAPFYQLGIAIEDEAATLADQLQAAGVERLLVVHGSANWATRAAETIAEKWPGYLRVEAFESVKTITEAIGRGMLIDDSHLRSQQMLRTIGEHIEFVPRGRQDLDAIVALISPTEAQALRPALRFHFASSLPVFTTSQVVRSTDPKNRRALIGAQLTELPGFIAPSLPQQSFNDAFGLPASRLAGLYALGADACRLSAHLNRINAAEGFAIDGVTGALTLNPDGRFERELGWAMLTADRVVPAPRVTVNTKEPEETTLR